MKPKVLLVLVLSFLFFGVSSVFAKVDLPNPIDYVSDFAEVLSPQFEVDLNQKLKDFEAQTENQLFVVTIKSLGDMTIEEYGVELGQKWAVGQKDKDNGAILLFAPNDRKVRIEVGYGLEPVLTDGITGDILDTEFIPEYRKNNYEQAISNTVTKIQFYLNDPSQIPEPSSINQESSARVFGVILFLIFTGVPIYFFSYLSRSKEIYTGGIVGTILGVMFGGIFGGFSLGLMGLLLDYILSKNYKNLKSSGKSTNFWTSRGGFRGGGGFGGGGGFSGGGGGSFGGGGSSRSL